MCAQISQLVSCHLLHDVSPSECALLKLRTQGALLVSPSPGSLPVGTTLKNVCVIDCFLPSLLLLALASFKPGQQLL